MLLKDIYSPGDLKNLTPDRFGELADEMRQCIIDKVNTTGGHMGPNLGIVETTIALHYVFNSPNDRMIFDVSHQCYPHKMLTGRQEGFSDPDFYMFYTGYTAPEESVHDIFKVGHTSTSVSLAVGVAKARDLIGGDYNVIAIIGDGSLSGGEAYEGLNNAATLGSNIIIIVNDNEMSIAENHGGLYANLKELRESNGTSPNNFFKTLGFDYYYVEEGNNTQALIEMFNKVKDIDHPTVVHIHTLKGKGLAAAEADKETYHWTMPINTDEEDDEFIPQQASESYTSVTLDYIKAKADKDKTVMAICAGTPGVFGYTPEYRNALGEQYTDVGVAEEHAVAYASALANQGAKPILSLMSSFVQRTYDQLSQDLALNKSPITMLIYWGGISNADATHLCTFDVSLISNIPNLVYLAPTNKEEYLAMLDWSVEQTLYPVAIRVPTCDLVSTGVEDKTDYSDINKFKMIEEGSQVAILALGNFFSLGQKVKQDLKTKFNIDATLINPVYMTGLDCNMLEHLKRKHRLVVTLEDNILSGGFGEKVSRFYGNSSMEVICFGAFKEFTDRTPLNDLYQRYHLTPELIVDDIAQTIGLLDALY